LWKLRAEKGLKSLTFPPFFIHFVSPAKFTLSTLFFGSQFSSPYYSNLRAHVFQAQKSEPMRRPHQRGPNLFVSRDKRLDEERENREKFCVHAVPLLEEPQMCDGSRRSIHVSPRFPWIPTSSSPFSSSSPPSLRKPTNRNWKNLLEATGLDRKSANRYLFFTDTRRFPGNFDTETSFLMCPRTINVRTV
jgi:hypothetical protein